MVAKYGPKWHQTRVDVRLKDRPCARCGSVVPMLASRKYCKSCSSEVKSERAIKAWKIGNLKKRVPLIEKICPVCDSKFMGFERSIMCSSACRKERIRIKTLEFSRSQRGRRKITQTLLKKNYGITLEDKERMMSEQGMKCPICKSTLENLSHSHVDHDHETGKVRSVLCRFCNVGLGAFKENPNSLLAAVEYLNKHK